MSKPNNEAGVHERTRKLHQPENHRNKEMPLPRRATIAESIAPNQHLICCDLDENMNNFRDVVLDWIDDARRGQANLLTKLCFIELQQGEDMDSRRRFDNR